MLYPAGLPRRERPLQKCVQGLWRNRLVGRWRMGFVRAFLTLNWLEKFLKPSNPKADADSASRDICPLSTEFNPIMCCISNPRALD